MSILDSLMEKGDFIKYVNARIDFLHLEKKDELHGKEGPEAAELSMKYNSRIQELNTIKTFVMKGRIGLRKEANRLREQSKEIMDRLDIKQEESA